jgi:AhpD family alkylhydroperoxidase
MSTTIPTARTGNPALVLEGAYDPLMALGKAVGRSGVDPRLLELISLRASQINGCGACAVQHPRIAKRLGETEDRINAVTAWREAPYFTEAERAALALTEAATRIADRPEPVSDELWDEVTRNFDEQELSALLLAIAGINVWNRLNVVTRQVAGAEW